LVLHFGPFRSVAVKKVEVIERSTLVSDSAVSSEDIHFFVEEVGGAVGTGLGGTNFGLRVFGLATGTLVRRLHPVKVG